MNDRTRTRDTRDEPRGRGSRDESRGTDTRRSSSRDVTPETASPRRGLAEEYRGRDRDSGRSTRGADEAPRRGGRDSGERNVRSGQRSFTYQERNKESVQKRASMGNTDFDKIVSSIVKMWAPGDGANIVRILPPTWADAKHFGVDIHVHYGIGPDRQSYLCLQKMRGEPCPICEERAIAVKDGDEEYAKELDARRRVLVYIIDRDAEKEGLQVWAMPQSIDQDLAKVSVDKRTGAVLPIDHPNDGFDVEFDKEGKGKNTKYKGLAISRNPSELGNDDWLDQAEANPLPTVLEYQDYDYIAKVFGSAPVGDRNSARGDDRGSSDRPNRDADRDAERSRDRGGRDEPPASAGRGGSRAEPPAQQDDPTWDEVHAMNSEDLDILAEAECPKLDPTSFKTDEDLADAICEDMGIPKPRASRASAEPVFGGRARLTDMRERR